MAKIARFDPFGSVARFDPFFDVEDWFRTPTWRGVWPALPEAPQIKLDITEDDKAYRVKAEVPGVKKEDIKVSIDGNQVAISAEAKKETEEKKGQTVVRSERYYGKEYRAFTLAQDIDQEKAEAKYEDGILDLVLPKKENGSAKQIAVK